MQRDSLLYGQYVSILKEELRPAMGCTEPIALAYAGAKATQLLGTLPERVCIAVSGNIIKNVKSVVVPNTGGLRGIAAAVCAGIVAGDPERELEVIRYVTQAQQTRLRQYLQQVPVELSPAPSDLIFDIDLTVYAGEDQARVRIVNHHTNLVHLSRNDQVLLDRPVVETSEDRLTDKSCLSIEKIVEFADSLEISDVEEYILRQIEYNMAIAKAGLEGNWGANIGTVILRRQGSSLEKRACAYAAAGSDARMSGCEKPVIILSGSGN